MYAPIEEFVFRKVSCFVVIFSVTTEFLAWGDARGGGFEQGASSGGDKQR